MSVHQILTYGRKSFRLAFPNMIWWWSTLIVTALLSLPLIIFGFQVKPESNDQLYYLLSAQAETLGSLFVLAFTFTLVAAQINSRYSHTILHRVIGPWALWYAIPFVVGILLPLFLLGGEFYLWSTTVSLIIASYCVLSLLPYAVAVRMLLSISDTLADMKSQLYNVERNEAVDVIRGLGNVSLGALNLKDYETFELGVNQLVDGASTSSNLEQANLLVVQEIRRLILRTVDEPFASLALGDAMFKLSIELPMTDHSEADGEMLTEVVEAFEVVNIAYFRQLHISIPLMKNYADVAVERGDQTVVSRLLSVLRVIGDRLISEPASVVATPQDVVGTMGQILQRVMNDGGSLEDSAGLVRAGILQIELLGNRGVDTNISEVRESAIDQLHRVRDNTSVVGARVKSTAIASLKLLDG